MLTSEQLKAYASGEMPCGSIEVEEIFAMARELLAIREAGDEEADGYHGVVQYFLTNTYLEGEDIDDRITAQIGNDKLRDIAITRGQQLREALAEIERLSREHADILSECDLVSAGGEPGRFTIALKAKILPLIAAALEEQFYETPEAMNFFTLEVAGRRLGKMEITCRKCTGISPAERIDTLTAERDEARKELAALKSAPGMAEIDAMERELLDEIPSWSQRTSIELLTDLARRSIAAREEVVGLLEHILGCIITVKQENTPEWMEYIAEEVNKINEAIGDPDRVVVNCCDIVIVRGKSEIVEGK